MPFAWSPAALDDLHRLYVRERRTAAETARAMGRGVTRNAVLGKVQRMGWIRGGPRRPPREPEPAFAKPQLAPTQGARLGGGGPFSKVLPLPKLREITVISTPKLWTERGERECAFPVGEPAAPGMQFSCCAPVARRRAYCPAHWALMTLEGTAMTVHDVEIVAAIARRAA